MLDLLLLVALCLRAGTPEARDPQQVFAGEHRARALTAGGDDPDSPRWCVVGVFGQADARYEHVQVVDFLRVYMHMCDS
jgi:hypothetical protein